VPPDSLPAFVGIWFIALLSPDRWLKMWTLPEKGQERRWGGESEKTVLFRSQSDPVSSCLVQCLWLMWIDRVHSSRSRCRELASRPVAMQHQVPLQAPLQTVPGLCPQAAPCGGTCWLSFDRLLYGEEFPAETMSWWQSDQTSPHFFLKQGSLFVGISLSTKQSGSCVNDVWLWVVLPLLKWDPRTDTNC